MDNKEAAEVIAAMRKHEIDILKINALELAIKALEQEPCEDAISRQEAIDTICNTLDEIDHVPQWVFDRLTDCLNELPSINPKPCGDAISRQAVLDMIDNAQIITDGEFRGYCTEDIDINILPSVSTEKTGRWEWVQYDSNPNIGNWHCSECRNIVFQCVEKKGIHNEVIYKFCPWCGAKMEVEE